MPAPMPAKPLLPASRRRPGAGRAGAPYGRRPARPSRHAFLLAFLLPLAAGCDEGWDPVEAERAILERERENLRALLATPPGPLIPPGDVLVALRGDLFQTVLRAALPRTETIADRFRVTLQTANVNFRSGLALVELDGRAALRERPDVFADITLLGLMDVVGIDAGGSSLRGRVEVVGLRTREVGVGGLAPPAERLVDALARRRTEEFNRLVGDVEIPVSLREQVWLPPVAEKEVTALGDTLRFQVRLLDVKAVGDRVWISLGADLELPAAEPTEAAEAGEEAAGTGGAAGTRPPSPEATP